MSELKPEAELDLIRGFAQGKHYACELHGSPTLDALKRYLDGVEAQRKLHEADDVQAVLEHNHRTPEGRVENLVYQVSKHRESPTRIRHEVEKYVSFLVGELAECTQNPAPQETVTVNGHEWPSRGNDVRDSEHCIHCGMSFSSGASLFQSSACAETSEGQRILKEWRERGETKE